jgi:tetratricopeptide (TPR) repeat protein
MPTKQEARKTKAREGDVIELLEDLPKYDLKKGQRGIVITTFDSPREAYDLSIEDGEGQLLGFVYSVKPEQFRNLTREAFDEGMTLLEEMNLVEATKALRAAIELQPSYIGNLLNSVLNGFDLIEDKWAFKTYMLKFVVSLDPEYKHAKDNLAIAYLNWGNEIAQSDHTSNAALRLFQKGLTITSDPEVVAQLQKNLAASFTAIGIKLDQEGKSDEALQALRVACSYFPNESTRKNYSFAAIKLAFVFMEKEEYEGAITAFEEAEDAGLLYHEVTNDYGVALAYAGRIEDARRAFERALQMSPDNPVILHNLERISRADSLESFERESTDYPLSPIPLKTQPYHQVAA